MSINYYAYIQSDEWRQRADAAKRRAGFRCQVCNRSYSRMMLNAHHRTYERLGHERDDDITVLCRECHELYHIHQKLPRPPQPPPMQSSQKEERSSSPPKQPTLSVPADGIYYKTNQPSTQPENKGKQPGTTKGKAYRLTQGDKGGIAVVLSVLGLLAMIGMLNDNQSSSVDKNDLLRRPTPTYRLTVMSEPPSHIRQEATPTLIPPTATTAPIEARTEFYGTVKRGANIRQGPGTGYPVVRTVVKGAQITIAGYTNCNSDIWYQVDIGQWIAAFLVDVVRVDVPYVEIECKFTASPTPTPMAPTSTDRLSEDEQDFREASATDTALDAKAELDWWADEKATLEAEGIISSNCAGGCTQYPDWCAPPIKGNISYNTGEKIYHLPGQEYYNDTLIDPGDGERWFCTEQEAQAAGWRRAKR